MAEDTTTPDPDVCRPVTLPDGEVIRVRGAEELPGEGVQALAAVVDAARQRFADEHPDTPPVLAQVLSAVEDRAAAEELLLRTVAKAAGIAPSSLVRVQQGAANAVTVGELAALARWAGLELTSEPANRLEPPAEPPTALVTENDVHRADSAYWSALPVNWPDGVTHQERVRAALEAAVPAIVARAVAMARVEARISALEDTVTTETEWRVEFGLDARVTYTACEADVREMAEDVAFRNPVIESRRIITTRWECEREEGRRVRRGD